MMKFVRKTLTLLLALAALGLGATQALAADVTYIYSNPITNVQGSSEYIGIGDPSKIKAWASEKDYGIATEVFVCTNPNGKFDHEKSILSQSKLVSAVTYWKLTPDSAVIREEYIRDGEIYSTNVPITQRREGTSILAGMKYKYNAANDVFALPEGMPAPTENSAEAFKAWSEDPVNAAYIIDRAVAAACGSTRDKATPSNWNTLYSSVKSKLTKVPKLNLTTFTVKVKDGVLQTGGVEWVVVYSDKILYYEKDAGGNAVRLKMWDCNEMGLADSATGLQAADIGADYADQIEMCEGMSNYAALLKSMLGSFKNTALSLPVTGIGSIPEVNGKLQETKSAYEGNRLAFVGRIPQEFTEAGDRVIELALDYANLAAWGRSGVAAQAGYTVQIEELFGTTNPQKVRTMVEEFFAKTISGYEDTAAYYLRMAESLTVDKEETEAALTEGSGYYAKMVGSFSHYTHPRTMYLESPIFGHSNVLSTTGGKTATNASTGYTYRLYNNDTLINTGGWAITFLDQDCICCDCDAFCPCKFDRAGSRIKAGDCRCFGTGANSHEGHIPCTPDYPDNCLCAKHSIGVLKVDATTGAGLGGAVMRLTSKTTGQVITGTTNANGSLIFRGVHLGNWYLDEVTAPNEYVRSDERIDIELTTSGVKVYGATTTPKYMGGLAYAPYNDSNPITAIYTNEKSSLIVPAAGDNILYAYQLTKSFTNATNFSNYVNFPTNVAPSYINCSGETPVSNSRSYPYGYTLKGGVSTTYHPEWDETVQKRQWNEEKRKWEQVEEIVHHDAYNTYSYTYLHNNAHRVGYTWESGDVTVPLGAYLSSGSFSSGGMEKYKIMHNGRNYLYGFNLNGAFTVGGTSNLFKGLTAKTWISHRNGALTSQSNEIKLAAYMGNQNAAYRSFYQTYTGNTPNASNSNDTNPSSYATANGIAMGTTHGGICSREYTATYCNGLRRTESYSASTNNATQKYQYSVEGTYKAGARTVIGSTVGNDVIRSTSTKSYSTENGTIYRFLTPSNVFSFYPTYRMWYTDTLGNNDGKTAWMLSAGRRTFQATDMVTVKTSGGTTDVWAPWSRDWEDKYMEGSEYMNEVRRPYSVIKSGMVVKAVQSEPATITIKAAFHIQDPKYAINGTEAAVTAANNAKAREMMAQVKEIANSYTGNLEAEFGFYSNLWEATSQNIASRVPALDVKPASYATTESPKTRLEPVVKKTANAPAYTFTSVSASPDSPVSSLGAITLDGHTYSASNGTLSANISNHTGSQRAMGYLLDTAFSGSSKYFIGSAANSASGDKSRWYEEYYDGIRVCIITCTIKVPSEGIMTEYHQVHSQLSDSTTPMNAEAKNLTVYGTRLLKDGMFGIGLCAIPGNGMTVFGNTYNNNILIWPAKHFGVRGSVYDLAQHAGQEILYYNSAWY